MTNLRKQLTIILFVFSVTLQAQQEFSQREQQSISTETPGLFERSDAFSVDFGLLGSNDYSFPLPVGKAEGIRKNNNVVISTTEGDAVKSMFSGRVRLSRHLQQWGNTVVVRHDNGLETVYGNNAQNLVRVGDRVKAGQTIAIVGRREDKTYTEFAVMVNGARLNPETLVDLKSHRLRKQTLLFTRQGENVKITVLTEEKEQSLAKSKGRRQPRHGNMSSNQNRTVKETSSASTKYTRNSEHIAQQQDDSQPFDIDEYQAIQLDDHSVTPFRKSNEFSVNFAKFTDADWCYPMKGGRVISSYGGRRRHAGTDIKTKAGDPIYAVFDGEVTLSGRHYGYGLCIVIRHANGLETLYSHQSKNLVKVGEWVKAGQQIGIVGRTGRATTEHCHFEVRCNGRPFDSAKIFDHANRCIRKDTFVFRKGKNGVTITSAK